MRHSIQAVAALVLVSFPGVQAIPVGSLSGGDGLVPQHDLEPPAAVHRMSKRHHPQNHTISVYGAFPRTREEQHRQMQAEEKQLLMPLWVALEDMLAQRVSQEVSAHEHNVAHDNRTDEMMVYAAGLFSEKGLFGKDSAFAKYRECADGAGKDMSIKERVENNIVVRTRAPKDPKIESHIAICL